jgi:hypothetical protein
MFNSRTLRPRSPAAKLQVSLRQNHKCASNPFFPISKHSRREAAGAVGFVALVFDLAFQSRSALRRHRILSSHNPSFV